VGLYTTPPSGGSPDRTASTAAGVAGEGGGAELDGASPAQQLRKNQGLLGGAAVVIGVGAVVTGICCTKGRRRKTRRGYSRAPMHDEDSAEGEEEEDFADEQGDRDDIWAQQPAWGTERRPVE